MASRTFLSPKEHEQLLKQWRAQKTNIAPQLGEILFERLQSVPKWQAAEPIALGSWARQELSPGSDIDLLFAGKQDVVEAIVEHFNINGWPLRYRMPADTEDWTVGVKDFDVLALLTAKPLTPGAEVKLHAQLKKLLPNFKTRLKYWCEAIDCERRDREKRYDSIVNYMEPNLKYGSGGLRDLEQGLLFEKLNPEHFVGRKDIVEKLQKYKQFFLNIRQALHLLGYQDILVSQAQVELAEAFGYDSEVKFMTAVQKALTDVSFYSDWMSQAIHADPEEFKVAHDKLELSKAIQILLKTKKTKRSLAEEHIRQTKIEMPTKKSLARIVSKTVNYQMADQDLISLFRSRILHRIFPDLDLIEGLVQHDQYHRFSADAHLLQVMREVLRARKKPFYGKKLTPFDWDVLFWTALFHDLCKGRKGDHSLLGADLVKRQMTQYGFSLRLTVEVSWMVKEHLLMSQAAFRFNPRDPRTWKKLILAGVKRDRATRLGVFTALDIKGTNPEAWNPWKEKLLGELISNLESSGAKGLLKFYEDAQDSKLKFDHDFMDRLDPRLLEAIPAKRLAQDSMKLKGKNSAQKPVILKAKVGEWWVRFHAPNDQKGLFLRYVFCLHSLGASIQEAYIQTFTEHGVYDWFKIRAGKTRQQLENQIEKLLAAPLKTPEVAGRFSVIDASPIDENETLISFRGKDHKGALLAAATAIYSADMPIIWAKVGTWGRQIDDVFSVKVPEKIVQGFLATQAKALLERAETKP